MDDRLHRICRTRGMTGTGHAQNARTAPRLSLHAWRFALCLVLLLAGGAQAYTTITQSFMNSTAPGWVLGGGTTLTSGGADPSGNGWLRLTSNAGNQAGYTYYNTAFTTANGFQFEFEYGSWGGTGADGFTVFLFDGATATFNIGDFGGSLGYANGCTPTPGLSNGYIGIAFDEYGNYTNTGDRCKNGGPGALANTVGVRGAGNGVDTGTNYFYLTHNQLSTTTQRIDCPSATCGATRPAPATYYRQVRITMLPLGGAYTVLVETRFGSGNAYEPVINTYTLPTSIYATLKIGFGASTGGSTNYHEIRNLTLNVFDTTAEKEISGGFTAPLFAGGTASYQAVVRNNGVNTETGPITVTSTIPAGLSYTGYSGSGWTCSYTAPTATCTNSSSLPSGSSAPTLTLNANVTGAAGSTITMTATVSGVVYDYYSANNTVSSSRFVYGGSSTAVKSLYMYFNSAGAPNTNTLQRVVPATDSNSGTLAISGGATPYMTQSPSLARSLTINATTIQVPVCLQRNGATGGSVQRNARVDLDYTGASTGTIGSVTLTNVINPNNTTPRTVTFSVPVASAITLPAGTTIRARVVNTSTTANATFIASSYTAGGSCDTLKSRVDLTSSTVVNIGTIGIYNAVYPGGALVTSAFDNGATLYFRTLVSDPFGSADITGVDYALFNNGGTQVGSTAAMTLVNTNAAAGERTYEKSFTIPAWSGSVYSLRGTAKEGTEGTVTHVNATGLTVRPLPPLMSVTKVASVSSAAPGSNIGYTMTAQNLGTGNGTGVLVTDALPAFIYMRVNTYGALTPLQFVDGSPASGLTFGTPEYSNDNGATWTYVPVSGGGGAPAGYDANINKFRVPFSGSMPPGRQFTVNYEVRVK